MTRVTKGNNGITRGYSLLHRGVDIGWRGAENDYVLAHSDGKVVFLQKGQKHNTKAKGNASYGNCVKIKHDNGYYTLYAHLEYTSIRKGQRVVKGQSIGYIGQTGKAFGKHLHFEVRNTKDVRINPIKYIDADLPNNSNKVTSLYQVYDNKKKAWLPNVKVGSNDYAGNKGNNISGVYIDNATYRVHQKGGKWLPWVTNRNDYAGNLGKSIDAIQIKGKTYRVYDNKKGKWLPWVSSENDFAGNIGNSIGAIQIK
nr:MAG TPA: peptidase [Bacteriophage sp.]